MKKEYRLRKTLAVAMTLVSATLAYAGITNVNCGKWTVCYDDEAQTISLLKNGENVLTDVSSKFKFNSTIYQTSSYGSGTLSETPLNDAVGSGKKVVITYDNGSLPTVEQCFYLYGNADYLLADVTLSLKSGAQLSSNYIAPIFSEANNLFLPQNANNRFLTVPFDNDGFVTYGSYPLSRATNPSSSASGRFARDSISFEVTSIFNGETQKGMVIGSVTHDTWKSAIRLTGSPLTQGHISRLECFSGVTHAATRDEYNGVLQPHGAVKGVRVSSAKMMVGLFDDWRIGMETYADVNNIFAPRRELNVKSIWGWNSWGGMAQSCNYEGVLTVSDFIKEHFQDKAHFAPDGIIYVGLDSWDNMNWDERKKFVQHCKANGQEAGVYWTPWNDWSGSDSRAVEGNNGYTYSQARVKVNGRIQTGRVDPTAPATLSRINYYIDKFKDCGFKYIKLDFMSAGAQEADSYYNPDITTGIQAYNYGMNYLRERCGEDIILDLSISPLFPANYCDARRISCDAWGEMWHTSYMMNSYSFGWWLNRVYSFNDPDHLVMGNRSEGENISRVTTAIVTSYCILGDNLSTGGSAIGDPGSQIKAAKYFTYEKINDLINMRLNFRPAYGHKLFGANKSVDLFSAEAEDSYVIVHFNYSVGNNNVELDLSTLGIDASTIDIERSEECWTNASINLQDGKLIYTSPNDMARVFRLYKK